jgi:hypothetical protein
MSRLPPVTPADAEAFYNAHPDSLWSIPVIARVIGTTPAKIERDIFLKRGLGHACFLKIDNARRARKRDVLAYIEGKRVELAPTNETA